MSLHRMLRAAAGRNSTPVANTDPQFNYVSMLLHGDGSNGAQNNTFVDSSTNNFTITRNGNTTQGSLSPYGNLWSNYFDGNGDYLSVPDNAAFNFGSGDLTVEMWLYPTAPGQSGYTFIYTKPNGTGYSGVAIIQDPSSYAIKLYCSSTGSSWDLVNGATIGTLPANTWSHVAVSRSGANIRAFLNGVLGSTTAISTSSLLSTTSAVHVGSSLGNANTFFTGYVSNLRVVKGTAVYTSTFTPPTAPLTAVSGTSLLTCQSNRFIDNSANNFTITRNGDVRVTKESPFLPTAAYSTSTIGGSGYFDGNGDCIVTSSSSALTMGTGDFTVEVWYYQTAFSSSSWGGVVGLGSKSGGNISIMPRFGGSNNLVINTYSGTQLSTGAPIALNTWYHIAISRISGILNVYVNGARVASSTYSDNLTGTQLVVGRSYTNTDEEYTSGFVSNLRVIKGVGIYSGTTISVPTAPLTAITNTSLLLNFTNAGIFDNAAENALETVGNAQISTSVKKYGSGSMAFDGLASSYLLTNSGPQVEFGSGSFTIEFWVNFTTAPSNTVEYQLWHPVNHASGFKRLSILIYANSIGIGYFGTNVAVTSALSWTTGQWYHLAFVRNGNTWTIYRDGTSVGSGTDTSTLDVASGYYTGPRINGYIDDLRITKGVARYTANFTPPTAAFPDQ